MTTTALTMSVTLYKSSIVLEQPTTGVRVRVRVGQLTAETLGSPDTYLVTIDRPSPTGGWECGKQSRTVTGRAALDAQIAQMTATARIVEG